MYTIEVEREKKVVHIITSGLIVKEEGNDFLNNLKQTFQSVNTSMYYLIVDASNYNATTQDNKSLLKEAIEMYDKAPFIKKFFILPKSSVARMQSRNLDKTNLPNYLIEVKSYEEAVSMIGK